MLVSQVVRPSIATLRKLLEQVSGSAGSLEAPWGGVGVGYQTRWLTCALPGGDLSYWDFVCSRVLTSCWRGLGV